MNFLTESFDLPQNEQRKCLSWDMGIRTPGDGGALSQSGRGHATPLLRYEPNTENPNTRTQTPRTPTPEPKHRGNEPNERAAAGEVTGAQNRVKLTCANANMYNHVCERFHERRTPSGHIPAQSHASTPVTLSVTGRPSPRRPAPFI